MAYPPISSLPTPPSRQRPSTFAAEGDAFLGALPTFQSQVNAAGTYIDGIGAQVDADATIASAAADAAVAASGATQWVSGASYDAGDVVWSPVDFQTYRAKTTHSGVSTDPSSDTTNWEQISLSNLSSYTGNVGITGEILADSYNETYSTVSSSSGVVNLSCEAGNVFQLTLTEDVTDFNFTNPPPSGVAYGLTLRVIQDSTARTITWPAASDSTVLWPAATAPTLSTGSGEVDVFVFFTHDGGTNWYGFVAGQALG